MSGLWWSMARIMFTLLVGGLGIFFVTTMAAKQTIIIADNSCFIRNASAAAAVHCVANGQREVVMSAAFSLASDYNSSDTFVRISAYDAALNLLWRDVLQVCVSAGFPERHDLAEAQLRPCLFDAQPSREHQQLSISVYAPPEVFGFSVRYEDVLHFNAEL